MKKTLKKIDTWFYGILNSKCIAKIRSIITIIATIFIVILLFAGLGEYVATQLSNNNIEILFNLINVSLTLFGFCLVGGILEKKKVKDLNQIQINLLNTSLFFLTTTILILLGIAFAYIPYTMKFSILPIIGALFFFIVGILNIHYEIRKYCNTLPNQE